MLVSLTNSTPSPVYVVEASIYSLEFSKEVASILLPLFGYVCGEVIASRRQNLESVYEK